MLLRTSFTDPGIIPRATSSQSTQIENQMIEEEQRNSNHTGYRPPVSIFTRIFCDKQNRFEREKIDPVKTNFTSVNQFLKNRNTCVDIQCIGQTSRIS